MISIFQRQFFIKMNHITLKNNNINTVPLKKGIVTELKIDAEKFQIIKCSDKIKAIDVAKHQLTLGNIIALPTDTIYGFACAANNPQAIKKLYELKGRNETKPLAICVANINDLKQYGEANHLPNELLSMLLPGAVTIVLNRSKNLNNPYLNPGLSKIGIRIPDFEFLQCVCKSFPEAIALSSANQSGKQSTLAIEEFRSLWSQLGAVFDGGCIGLTEDQRAGSTVIDLSDIGFYKVIRNGVASKQTIQIMEQFGLMSNS